jgi:UDP-N-acetylglucosamine pyrophosphorylase
MKVDENKIVIYPYEQKAMGAVDFQGKLIVEDDKTISSWPVGTGDLWDILSGSDKSLGFPSATDLI